MITLTNSIFKTFLDCPARAMAMHKGRVLGDASIKPEWEEPATEAMAAGSLVDAMVTRGMLADETDRTIQPEQFYGFLKSSYDDGMKNAKTLCNRSGGWNAAAKKAILAAKRLLADPAAQSLLENAILQPRVSFLLDDDVTWQGDIDILTVRDGELHIIDLKSPGRTDDGWITSGGRNQKCAWHEAWSYWFQLAGYCYALGYGRDLTLNGAAWSPTAIGIDADAKPRAGILYCSREDIPEIGYIPVAGNVAAWEMILKSRTKFGGPSKLEIIRAIAAGQVEAPGCGKCGFCKSRSKVVVPDGNCSDDMPPIDDAYGLADII